VRKLDRSLLPQPADHYARLFGPLRFNPAGWAQVRCVFHEDHRASLSLHREKGAYRCFGCDARGGDLLDFEMRRTGQDFKSTAKALGAWR